MNLILFEPHELATPLPRHDPRTRHLETVLRCQVGDSFDAGVINGSRGRGTVQRWDSGQVEVSFSWLHPTPAQEPITLIVGLPRPQTARDILRDATTLGCAALHFVRTEKGDPNYALSSLWSSGEWRRHVIAGAAQAFTTRIPDVTFGRPLDEVLALSDSASSRIALDNYESPEPLSTVSLPQPRVTMVIGSERGWSADERVLLRRHAYLFAHLGARVLRTETAVLASLTLVRAKLGLL